MELMDAAEKGEVNDREGDLEYSLGGGGDSTA